MAASRSGRTRRERWLVRHEGAHVIGVLGDERQGVHRATAAGKHVDRPASELLDDLVDVVGMLLGCRRGRRLGQLAALASAWVVGDHGAVGEVAGQGAEAGGAHRRGDQEQGSGVRRTARPDVVGQGRARDLEACEWFPRSSSSCCSLLASSARIASIWPTASVIPSSWPMARSCSMASVLGKMLTIDIRVRPASTSSIVTRISPSGISVFGEPSSLAKPSRTTRECGGSTSWTSQYPRGWSPSGRSCGIRRGRRA